MDLFVFDLQQLNYIARMIIAGVCGIIIGLERKNRSKEAGIRTHCVVACAAALMMIVSKYAFFDVIKSGAYGGVEVRLDPSRVASTIASGIGFLGAGMIFVHKNMVTGLTTAAGIWATSGVGMAIGAGMYVIGISATIILVLAQVLLHLNIRWIKIPKTKTLIVKEVDKQGYQTYITDLFREHDINVHDVAVESSASNDSRNYTFIIEIPHSINEDDIMSMIEYKSIIKSNL